MQRGWVVPFCSEAGTVPLGDLTPRDIVMGNQGPKAVRWLNSYVLVSLAFFPQVEHYCPSST